MTTKLLPLTRKPSKIVPARQTTDLAVHVVVLHRRTVLDMLLRVNRSIHHQKTTPRVPGYRDVDGSLNTLAAYLDAALTTDKGDAIELRGTRTWINDLLTAAGDMATAIEVGMQLEQE